MRVVMIWLTLFVGGCLGTGCIVAVTPADKLFGGAASAPKLVVKKTWSGFYAEAGTNFSGTLKAHYNPDTKAFDLDGAVNSDAGTVLDKYPAWIASMETQRQMDYVSRTQIQGQVNEQLARVDSMIEHLGDKAAEVLPKLFPGGIGVGGGTSPAASPVGSILAIWTSLPESERAGLLAKLTGAVVPTPVPVTP